jgi:adenylyl- and sulfurtransferase ThiI
LFLMSLILCHDCVPNTKHFVNFIESDVDIQRYQMTFQTTGESSENRTDTSSTFGIISSASSVPVKKGEHLTTTYTDTLKSTLERRRHLAQTKIFDCDCRRCRDPFEFSSNLSSWLCRRCDGVIVSTNPLDNKATWQCKDCKSTLSCEVRIEANDERHGLIQFGNLIFSSRLDSLTFGKKLSNAA